VFDLNISRDRFASTQTQLTPRGAFAKDIARHLAVRSDWERQYIADAFGSELAWLRSPAATRSCVSRSATG
jgi:hypothetical protein